jgi:flagellar basal-body rod modification protein FlgD
MSINGVDSNNFINNTEINKQLSAGDRYRTEQEVRASNLELEANNPGFTQSMGKDEFLKILITQLQNQDPTSPMEDKEFIAQMAQFSSLEQITNMAGQFEHLANLMGSGQAVGVLGRYVEILQGDQQIQGLVQEVTNGDNPQVMVNGRYYDFSEVSRIMTAGAAGVQNPVSVQRGVQSYQEQLATTETSEQAIEPLAPENLAEQPMVPEQPESLEPGLGTINPELPGELELDLPELPENENLEQSVIPADSRDEE